MPWKSVFENGKWKVKSIQDGSVKGSHPTKQRADAQVRALYAKAPDKGMRHGGAVRKNNLPATSPTRPSSLGQASSSSTVGMGHGGKVTAYKKGQPMAGGMGMRGGGSMKKMAGYKHGGETGMAYESQGPNHEGTLPQTTPPTTKLQANVIGKGGAVLPGKRYGGKVKKNGRIRTWRGSCPRTE